jgi:hypothetical protein
MEIAILFKISVTFYQYTRYHTPYVDGVCESSEAGSCSKVWSSTVQEKMELY